MSFTYSEQNESAEELGSGSFNKRSSLRSKNYDSEHSETRKTVKFNDHQDSESEEVEEVLSQDVQHRVNHHEEAYTSDNRDVIHMDQDEDSEDDMFGGTHVEFKEVKNNRTQAVHVRSALNPSSVKRPQSVSYRQRETRAGQTEFDRLSGVFLPEHDGIRYKKKTKKKTKTVKVRKCNDDYSFSNQAIPFTLACKDGPDCGDHDWLSKRAPIRLVCTKGPGCMNHEWTDKRNPVRRLNRHEIMETLQFLRGGGKDYQQTVSSELKCNVKRFQQVLDKNLPHAYHLRCRKGPHCKNHDWLSKTSPMQLVCKNGPSCKNHDWYNHSTVRLLCKDGPTCHNHDWGMFGINSDNLYDKYKEEDGSLFNQGMSITTVNSGKCKRHTHSGCSVGCHQHFHVDCPVSKKTRRYKISTPRIPPPSICETACCKELVRSEIEYQAKRRQERYLKDEQMKMFTMTLERKKNQHKAVNYMPYFYPGAPISVPTQQTDSGCNSNTMNETGFRGFGIAGQIYGMPLVQAPLPQDCGCGCGGLNKICAKSSCGSGTSNVQPGLQYFSNSQGANVPSVPQFIGARPTWVNKARK